MGYIINKISLYKKGIDKDMFRYSKCCRNMSIVKNRFLIELNDAALFDDIINSITEMSSAHSSLFEVCIVAKNGSTWQCTDFAVSRFIRTVVVDDNSDNYPEMLATAVALHEGFEYKPSQDTFWKQSKGSENSFLYVTTNYISESILENIEHSMKESEYLIIACTSFEKDADKKYKNIKIKKIPEMLLSKCEFGKDNYDLNIINPPEYEEEGE